MNIQEVKETHEDELMEIEGVTGIGVNLIKNTIVVYVETLTSELKEKIPKEIEGFEIEILETGKVEALEW